MKLNWKDSLLIIISALLVISLIKVQNISTSLERKINSMQNEISSQISDLENNVSNISNNVRNVLEEQSSIIATNDFTINNFDSKNNLVNITFSLLPKEYTKETTVSANINNKVYPAQFKNGVYTFDMALPISETIEGGTITITDGEINKNQKLDYYINPLEDYKLYMYGSFDGKITEKEIENNTKLNISGSINVDINKNSNITNLKKECDIYFVSNGNIIDQKSVEIESYESISVYIHSNINKKYEIEKNADLQIYVVVKDEIGLYHVTPIDILHSSDVAPLPDTEQYQIYNENRELIYSENN